MPHYTYFTSSLSEEDFRAEIEKAMKDLSIIDKRYRVNRVHRDKEYLNFGFLCVQDPGFYYALLGYNLDGTERICYIEKEGGEVDSWADCEYEEEILPPLVTFENIRFYEAELPELREEFSPFTLCCRNFPEELISLLPSIEKELSFYSSTEDYPKTSVREIPSGRMVLFVSFSRYTGDAQKALFMIKQFSIAGHVLKFSQSYKKPKKDIIKKNL